MNTRTRKHTWGTRPNSFKNFFAEPFSYNDSSYGYAVDAKDTEDALDKYMAYFADWHWITDEHRKHLKADLRANMQNCWVRWGGFRDDDGEFYNGWVITSEYHGGQKGWFHVFSSNYQKHYVETGHHFERKVDEDGRQQWNRDCAVCEGGI